MLGFPAWILRNWHKVTLRKALESHFIHPARNTDSWPLPGSGFVGLGWDLIQGVLRPSVFVNLCDGLF